MEISPTSFLCSRNFSAKCEKFLTSAVDVWWSRGNHVNLGLEYRVTDPLDSDHTRVKYSADDELVKTELTKVKLSTSEVLASLSYAFQGGY